MSKGVVLVLVVYMKIQKTCKGKMIAVLGTRVRISADLDWRTSPVKSGAAFLYM